MLPGEILGRVAPLGYPVRPVRARTVRWRNSRMNARRAILLTPLIVLAFPVIHLGLGLGYIRGRIAG